MTSAVNSPSNSSRETESDASKTPPADVPAIRWTHLRRSLGAGRRPTPRLRTVPAMQRLIDESCEATPTAGPAATRCAATRVSSSRESFLLLEQMAQAASGQARSCTDLRERLLPQQGNRGRSQAAASWRPAAAVRMVEPAKPLQGLSFAENRDARRRFRSVIACERCLISSAHDVNRRARMTTAISLLVSTAATAGGERAPVWST